MPAYSTQNSVFRSEEDTLPTRDYMKGKPRGKGVAATLWSKSRLHKKEKHEDSSTYERRHSVGSLRELDKRYRTPLFVSANKSRPATARPPSRAHRDIWGFYRDHVYRGETNSEDDIAFSRQAPLTPPSVTFDLTPRSTRFPEPKPSPNPPSIPKHLMDFYKSTTVWDIYHRLERDRIYNQPHLNHNINNNYIILPSGKSLSLDPHLWRTNYRSDLFQNGVKSSASVDGRSDISTVASVNGPAKFSMLEFAMLNYRDSPYRYPASMSESGSVHNHNKKIDSLRIRTADRIKKGSKKGTNDWTWRTQVAMIKWTRDPIQDSLLKFENSSLNKAAVECFYSIMRYMGDYPLSKGQKPVDCVFSILMACHKNPEMADEVYCQLAKQTTNNRSTKPESEQQGWRLMCIMTAYFKCSRNLYHYLNKYLEQAAFDANRPHNGSAQTSLQNLRQTFKYGGRKNVPSKLEVEALTRGRNTKRQMCILPGGTPVMLNMKSSSVVQDVIVQICGMLGISDQHMEESEEFTVFYVIEADNRYCPLARNEYVFDITTELSNHKKTFYLLCQRTSWVYPIDLNRNERYIDVIYNQCVPDYLDGFMIFVVSNTLPEHLKDDIATWAALQIRCNEKPGVVQKQQEVQNYIPRNVRNLSDMKPQNWTNKVNQILTKMPHMTPVECQKQFLEMLQRLPMFGATFFNIKAVHNEERIKGDCMLAINSGGLYFMDSRSHATHVFYNFADVLSTRRGNARDGDKPFIEIKVGSLYSHKVLRLVTEQGQDISSLISQYLRIKSNYSNFQR